MYIIKKINNNQEILYMEYDNISYPIKIASNSMHVDTIHLYDKKYIKDSNSNTTSFDDMFIKLTTIIFNYLYNNDEDSDDGSVNLLISEVDRLKNTLDSQFKELMKREEYYSYLDKLTFLKEELLNRKEIIKYKQNINNIITGKSR